MNEKLKAFFKEVLILLCLVVGINLFASHPSLEKRIAAIERMENKNIY